MYEKNVPKAGSGVAIGAALTAGLLITKGVLNPAVAISMGLVNSPATWATALSGIIFALLFKFFSQEEAADRNSSPSTIT